MRPRTGSAALLALAALAAGLAFALASAPVRPRFSPPPPAADPAQALASFEAIAARDSLELHDGCGSRLDAGPARAPRAVVLLHGFTNCPRQFRLLADSLRARGDAVVLPRLPYHGLADRMTEAHGRLDADTLAGAVAEAVALARGLGDTVVVVGLSVTGVAAAWAAQSLDGVDRAVLLAPAFAPRGAPLWTIPPLATLMRMADVYPWWDGQAKQALSGPTQAYYRFSVRAMGECYRLGQRVAVDAGREPPRARGIALVLTGADAGIDNRAARAVAARWQRHGVAVTVHEFERALGVNHDMVDPDQPDAKVALVYPVLLDLISP